MKKRVLLIITIFLILIGCSKNDDSKYKVGFVTDGEKLEEENRSSQIKNSLENFENIDISTRISEDKKSYLAEIENLTKRKTNLVIANSFLLNDEIIRQAELNEEISFLVFDSIIDPILKNIRTIYFNTNESSYLAGYLAAYTTKTNSIAYVGFEKGVISDHYEYGFRAGVSDGAKELGKDIEVKTENIYDLGDFEYGKELGNKLYNAGVDIIYQTAGYTGIGIIQSAINNQKLVIGYDIDQRKYAPQNVLTSTIKNYGKITDKFVSEYIYSDDIKASNINVGIKDDAVDLAKRKEDSLYSEELDIKLMDKKEKIKNNEIVVPFDRDTFSEYLDKD